MKHLRSLFLCLFIFGLVGWTFTSCQEKTIGVVGMETENDVARLNAQVQTLKTELAKTSKDYADFRTDVGKAITTLAVGLKLGDFVVSGKQQKNVVVKSVENDKLVVNYDGGEGIIPLTALDSQFQTLFAPERYVEKQTTVSLPKDIATLPTEKTEPEQTSAAGLDKVTSTFKHDSLVVIKTTGFARYSSGHGSGFLVRTPEGVFVYTNAHVLCGAPDSGFTQKITSVMTSTGVTIPVPAEIEFADMIDSSSLVGGLQDLARFRVNTEAIVAYDLAQQNEQPTIHQDVIAYGNSDGLSVIKELPGRVLGVGGDRIQVSCRIVPGNSGGPVVDSGSGRVVGVATYTYTTTHLVGWNLFESFRYEDVRRFAVRPEQVTKWRKVPTSMLYSMNKKLDDYLNGTRSMIEASRLSVRNDLRGFHLPEGSIGDYDKRLLLTNPNAGDVSKQIATLVIRINERLGGYGGKMSFNAIGPVYDDFYLQIKNSSGGETSSLAAMSGPPYLNQFIEPLNDHRKTAESYINIARQDAQNYFKERR